jgi:cysteinyl-tRNA synthetase
MIKVFNTLSGQKENLPRAKELKLFVCGPTVYDFSHIGHARTYLAFDAIVRYLRSQKIKIFYLQNITDIDDKIIDRAKERSVIPKSLAKEFEKAYYQDMKTLGIKSVDKYARATDHIKEIVEQVKTLIKKDHAYEIPGDGWYFDLSTFPEYGKLSHRTALQATDSVSRIDTSDKKRNVGDFALWKFTNNDAASAGGEPRQSKDWREPSWKTELGAGRPGWHIEDTAISEKFFGPQYDLHGGAVDLKFPHHEAEIAQQESASGKKPFVKIWMHTGFLLVNGEKMSKSLGNFTTIRDFLATHSPQTLRMMVLSYHYRSPVDYTPTIAASAKKNIADIKEFLAKLALITNAKKSIDFSAAESEKGFHAAMEDDFNTPKALAAIFEFMNEANKVIWKLSKSQAKEATSFIQNALKSLGFDLFAPKIPLKIAKLVRQRELFRKDKQFIQSDALRKEIEQLGFSIEDTPVGPLVLSKSD